MLKELVLKNRSYRRFDQKAAISTETLRELVDLARCSASATNRQPLKYILSNEPEKNSLIFETVAWAGLLRDIAQNAGCDHGIAAQSILLGAAEKGLGGCMLGSANKEKLHKNLNIPEQYDIALVVALGKPAEKVVLETLEKGQDFAYWRDARSVHHVPKRKLDDIIVG
jgi:nitroreductase